MSYLVFARKYRPQTFEQVVQQSHVTRTLANAIAAQRVAHAILFAGPRGTGKTTVARILAKAMNCHNGPTATPCNACPSCLEITAGHSADVFEIDGASNNSVDQVRELRENLKYIPASSRFKIYIIDEVHMLSLAAFNALLKTLEEPPEHVLFMFATTEVQKIPITILSRCQRHDLRRIDGQAIAEHLQFICEAEKAQIDLPSLALIAQEAGGSIRDGLSLLDHVLACAQGPVTVQLIGDLLGVVDRQHLQDMAQAVFQRDLKSVLEAIDAVWRHGYEMKRFYADLVAYFHQLSVLKMGDWAHQVVDLPRQELEQMRSQVENVPESYLLQIVDLLFKAEASVKFSSQPKLGLEMIFLKLFQTAPALPIETLIDQLDRLQVKVCSDVGPDQPNQQTSTAHAAQQAQATVPVENTVEAEPQQMASSVPMDTESLWTAVKDSVTNEKPSLAGFLNRCELRSNGEGQLMLAVGGNEFTLKNVSKQLTYLERICSQQLGQPVKLTAVADFADASQKKNIKRRPTGCGNRP